MGGSGQKVPGRRRAPGTIQPREGSFSGGVSLPKGQGGRWFQTSALEPVLRGSRSLGASVVWFGGLVMAVGNVQVQCCSLLESLSLFSKFVLLAHGKREQESQLCTCWVKWHRSTGILVVFLVHCTPLGLTRKPCTCRPLGVRDARARPACKEQGWLLRSNRIIPDMLEGLGVTPLSPPPPSRK